MNEHYLDEKDVQGEYVNFLPVLLDDRWKLKSLKTGKLYEFSDFLDTPDDSIYGYYHQKYLENLKETVECKLSPVFALNWLKLLLYYEALEFSEKERVEYLSKNLTPGLSPKKVGKVHRQSEEHHKNSFSGYFMKFTKY